MPYSIHKLFNDYLKRSLVVGPNAWWSSERLFTTPPQATITMVTAQHLGRRATATAGGGERSVASTPGVTFHPELITSTTERRAPSKWATDISLINFVFIFITQK